MIRIIDPEQLGNPVIDLGGLTVPNETDPHTCHRCDAFRPDPQPDGNLQVDPDIHLSSIGMDVDIAFLYNGAATANVTRTVSRRLPRRVVQVPAYTADDWRGRLHKVSQLGSSMHRSSRVSGFSLRLAVPPVNVIE